MNQRQRTHPIGTFAACAGCTTEPRHFVAAGRTAREGVTFAPVAERHQLECRCGRRTGWRDSLPEAERGWGELGETIPLALVIKPGSNVRSMRVNTKGRARG